MYAYGIPSESDKKRGIVAYCASVGRCVVCGGQTNTMRSFKSGVTGEPHKYLCCAECPPPYKQYPEITP